MAVDKTNIKAWWNFDNNDGFDSSGHGEFLTGTGSFYSGNSGIIGKSATVAAAAIGFVNPSTLSFGAGEMGISFWIKPTTVTGGSVGGMLIKGSIGTANFEYAVFCGLNIRPRFFNSNNSNYIGCNTNTAPLVAGVWQHIVVNKTVGTSPTTVSVWHNGVLQTDTDESAGTYTTMVDNGGSFSLGHSLGIATRVQFGDYDLVCIRGQAFSPAEIAELYNGGNGLNIYNTKPSMMQFF